MCMDRFKIDMGLIIFVSCVCCHHVFYAALIRHNPCMPHAETRMCGNLKHQLDLTQMLYRLNLRA